MKDPRIRDICIADEHDVFLLMLVCVYPSRQKEGTSRASSRASRQSLSLESLTQAQRDA
jgi:hypothetical protein